MSEQADFRGLVNALRPPEQMGVSKRPVKPGKYQSDIMKNGYTRVPHELLEKAISSGFSGRQHDLFWLVWRETEGRHRESFAASLRELGQRLHAGKGVVSKTVLGMSGNGGPLLREQSGMKKQVFKVNPDWIPNADNL